MPFFLESCMKKENGGRRCAITNNPIVSSMKFKQSIKDPLCYSESIYAHFRQNKHILQELWVFICVMTLRKAVHNHSDLEDRMLFASHTSNAVVLRHKRFALLYWVDWCLKAYLWDILNGMEPLSFIISMRVKSMERQSLPNLLYGYKTKHKTKGTYLYNHGAKYMVLNSSPSTMNKRKSVLQALLTRIRFNKGMCNLQAYPQYFRAWLSIKCNINRVISA